jgi:phage repressor protein C with HTH and peptisase S24 domain
MEKPLTTKEIRRLNLSFLEKEAGDREAFTSTPLAEKLKVSYGYVGQLVNGSRGIGDKTARKLEKVGDKPVGWIDIPHPEEWQKIGKAEMVKDRHDLRVADMYIEIKQHSDVAGAMGTGLVLNDQPGQIREWKVTREWVEKNIPANTGNKNLRIVTGFGDSMKGMFNSGDPLLIDAGVTDVKFDGVYFFRIGEEGFIKRLQRIPGQGIRALSENPAYEAWTITEDMDFQVLGRVLKVWEGSEF